VAELLAAFDRMSEPSRDFGRPSPLARPVGYVVCRPASRYYRNMTGVEWMPVLIGEVI